MSFSEVVVGFDVSKVSTGVVVFDVEQLETLAAKKKDHLRLNEAVLFAVNWKNPVGLPETEYLLRKLMWANELIDRLNGLNRKLVHVGFEQFAFRNSSNKAADTIMGTGLLRERMLHVAPYLLIAPGTMQKFVCADTTEKGVKRTKAVVMKNVYRRFGFDHDCEDVVDAFAIALMTGLAHVTIKGSKVLGQFTKKQQESVLGVLKQMRKAGIGLETARLLRRGELPSCEPKKHRYVLVQFNDVDFFKRLLKFSCLKCGLKVVRSARPRELVPVWDTWLYGHVVKGDEVEKLTKGRRLK